MPSRQSRPRFSLPAALVVMMGAIALVAQQRPRESAARDGTFGGRRSSDGSLGTQGRRAGDMGRGRRAAAPWHIPWRGWKDVLWRTYEEMQADRLMAIAAGVVFYSLLALFPAITAGVSIYALFADAGTIGKNVAQLSTVLPGGTIDIVSEQITRINQHGTGALSLGFVVGLGVALWSANAGMKALFDSLNVIYDEEEKRGFIKLNAVSMLFTLGAIALAFLMLMCVAVVPFLLQRVGLPSTAAQIIAYGRWVLLLAIGIGAMTVLYRIGPSRAPAQWRWLIFGSIFATIGWLAVSMLFSWYVANFGTYNATYGSLGAVVGMMMWMWLSMIVVLLGAELNSEIEHQTARDSTTEPPRPLGARGAVVADTVGSAKS